MSLDILDPILDRVHRGHCWTKTPDGPRRIDEPLTPSHVSRHLTGRAAFGVCPLAPGSSTVRLALLDFDSHKGETPWEEMSRVVLQVIDAAKDRGLVGIPFRSSGGNGVHLFFLWEEMQDAHSVREALRQILEACGLKNGTAGVANGCAEIFPKQSEVLPGKFGSMFVLPLSGKSVRLGVKGE